MDIPGSVDSLIRWRLPEGNLDAAELQILREMSFTLIAGDYKQFCRSISTALISSPKVNALAVSFALGPLFKRVQDDNCLCFTDKRFIIEELADFANAADAGIITQEVIDASLLRLELKTMEVRNPQRSC